MKRSLSLLLIVGALIGLFGQSAAFALGPLISMTSAPAVAPEGDCMAMMEKQSQPEQKPCKGLTLDCIAAMGCVVPFVLQSAAPLATSQPFSLQAFWPATAILVGTELTPDPEPPTILG